MEKNRKKAGRLAKIGLVCLVLLLVGTNVLWLLTRYVPYVNQDWVLVHPLKVHNLLEKGQFTGITSVSDYYPPLIPLVTAMSTLYLFGVSDFSSILSFDIFFVILLLSVYGIGRLLHDEWVGLFAAAIAGLIPIINTMSRTYNWDFPLGSMVCLSVYLLLRSEEFSNRKYSLLFGVSVGLGLLTKWSFPCFVIGPALYALYRGVRFKGREVLINSGLAAVIGLAIASVWYARNISIFSNIVTNLPGQWNLLPWYTYIFFFQIQMLVPMAIVGMLAFFYYCLRCKNRTVFWWIVIPYVVFSIIPAKVPRYTLPYLPAFAIAISYCVLTLTRKNKLLRIATCSAILGLMTVLLLSYTSGLIIPTEVTHGPLCFIRLTPTNYNICLDDFSYVAPSKDEIAVRNASEKSVEYVWADFKNRSPEFGSVSIGTSLCDPAALNFLVGTRINEFEHYALINKLDIYFENLNSYPSSLNPANYSEQQRGRALSKDYLILSSDSPDKKCRRVELVLLDMDWLLGNGFELVKSYSLPTNLTIDVLRKR